MQRKNCVLSKPSHHQQNPMISMWFKINYQLSIINCQLSIVNYQSKPLFLSNHQYKKQIPKHFTKYNTKPHPIFTLFTKSRVRATPNE